MFSTYEDILLLSYPSALDVQQSIPGVGGVTEMEPQRDAPPVPTNPALTKMFNMGRF
jgi:hypothetical protein